MRRLFALIALASFVQACSNTCTSNSDCAETDLCTPEFHTCRKRCTQPIDCSGDTLCSPLSNGFYACLKSNEIVKGRITTSTDTSLGALCDSPKDDGVSQPNERVGACGENAPLCNAVFAGDPSALGEIETCTTECNKDADCAAKAPPTCTGECKAQFDNLACFAALPLNAPAQNAGAKQQSGVNLTLYCRPRFFGYYVPKRCTADAECGKAGSRAGEKCSRTTDGGGACLSGKLGAFECCMREGECDHAPGGDPTKPLHCMASTDNASGYCTRSCTSDADCLYPGAPATASCWTTVYVPTKDAGQCTVEAAESPICRPTAKPQIPTPATKVVSCITDDRPVEKADNEYDSSLRACVRTF